MPLTRPHLTTLIMMTMATTLSLNMFLPGLPALAQDFDVSYGVASLSIGGYLAMTAVLSLILGPLSDRIGRRPVALGVLLVFIVASVGAALAPTIGWFLTCRLAQGVMVGGFILASAIVRDTRDGPQVASLLSYIASIMALAPMLGPMLGGLLTAGFGWRANFWVYAGLGTLLLMICLIDLRETHDRTQSKPAKGATRDLMRERQFLWLVATIALSTACFYTFLAGLPITATRVWGLGEAALGPALGSITAGFMAGSFTAGRITPRFGILNVMLAGRITTVVGLAFGLALVYVHPSSPFALLTGTLFIGIGNGLSLPNANAAAMSIHPRLAGTAAGITGSATVAAGAVMTTLAGLFLAKIAHPAELNLLLLTLAAASLATGYMAWHSDRTPRFSSG